MEVESRHPRPWHQDQQQAQGCTFGEHGQVRRGRYKSLDREFSGSDLYVSITPVRGKVIEAPIPVINGMPFLTGVGADACFDKIVETLGLK